MRKLYVAAFIVAFVVVLLMPDRFPIDSYRYEAQWACIHAGPCAWFVR
jgi:hypothetical protein